LGEFAREVARETVEAAESKGSVKAGGLRGSEESGGIVQVLKRGGTDLNIDVSLKAFVC